MFTNAYLVEILTPKRTDPVEAKGSITLFAERYCRILDLDLGLSVPDNPMGQPRFSLLEMIEQLGDESCEYRRDEFARCQGRRRSQTAQARG
jgi:hypothetical protein